MVAVLDIVARGDGAGHEHVRQVTRGKVNYRPLLEQLVALSRVGDVTISVRSFLGDCRLRLDHRRRRDLRWHVLERALVEPGGQLLS